MLTGELLAFQIHEDVCTSCLINNDLFSVYLLWEYITRHGLGYEPGEAVLKFKINYTGSPANSMDKEDLVFVLVGVGLFLVLVHHGEEGEGAVAPGELLVDHTLERHLGKVWIR